MKSKTIVVSLAGTTLSVDQSHYTLRSKGRKIGRIPPAMVDHLIISAEVEVTRKALERLMTTGVAVTFLNHQGRCASRLSPLFRNTPEVRIGQFRAWECREKRLQVAQDLVKAKIKNGRALYEAFRKNYPDPAIKKAAADLKSCLEKVDVATTQNELMGVEGWAARIYWGAFGSLIRDESIAWEGRNRRPPKDPVNAALSYGYAILLNRIITLIEASGLDAWIGFLHETSGRRPSLALDLMEPFRPAIVDRLVLRLLNLGKLQAHHFYRPQVLGETVHLNREGRLVLVEAFERMLPNCAESGFQEVSSLQGALNTTIAEFRRLAREDALENFQSLESIHAPAL